ncbi:MAG: FeoA family protein [Anaerolineae bacterium]
MMQRSNAIPLAEMGTGEWGTVRRLNGGRAVLNRLVSLGVTPGARVNMTQNYGRGPLIITVRGTRLALGRGEAEKILVERILE